MIQNRNMLSQDRYLISDELHEILATSRSLYKEGKGMVKFDEGIYLVSVRVLNSESKVLIYNYIYYPTVFMTPLILFLVSKYDFKN